MQARIIELENQVFVLREALLGAMSYLPGAVGTSDMSTCKSCGTAVTSGSIKYCKKCIWKLANKALQTPAPARWEKMQRVVNIAKFLIARVPGTAVFREILDELESALADLEGGGSNG